MQIAHSKFQFGSFEVSLRDRELRRNGLRVHLTDKPFEILVALLEKPGHLVTREELQQRLWPDDTFVDFDNNLNGAVRRLRRALGENAEQPRFVETVPRHGYRFIGPLKPIAVSEEIPMDDKPVVNLPAKPQPRTVPVLRFTLGFACVASVLVWWVSLESDKSQASPRPMLAVLPFLNLSGDPLQDYVSDGLTEETIAQLGSMAPDQLGVIARTSVMGYQEHPVAIDQIGEQLGVDYVVEGSVRRSGDGLRITAQLIDVSDQTHLWAESWDRTPQDLLAVQVEIGQRVADALSLALLPQPAPRAVRPEAMDAYWRGRYLWNKGGAEALTTSLQWFETAIQRDPQCVVAWVGLADAHNYLGMLGCDITNDHFELGRKAALHAISLDQSLGRAHAALGFALMHGAWDWPKALDAFTRALKLDPGNAIIHHWAAACFSSQGRHQRALAAVKRAIQLDPLSDRVCGDLGWYCYYAGRYQEALRYSQRALELEPTSSTVGLCMVLSLQQLGRDQDAVAELERNLIQWQATEEVLAEFWQHTGRDGLPGAWRWLLDRMQAASDPSGGNAYALAVGHMVVNERSRVYEMIETAIAQHQLWVPYVAVDPSFADLHNEPRFQSIAQKLDLKLNPPETW